MTGRLPADGPMARVLARHRDRFNAAFAQARRTVRGLDPDAFSGHLIGRVGPLLDRMGRMASGGADDGALDAAGVALYDLSLELFAKGILGGPERYPAVGRAWADLFPRISDLILAAPRRLPAALVNALCQLTGEPGAAPERWLETLAAVAPLCSDPETLLRAGQAAAWRWGLAHYREGALSVCDGLPPEVTARILGLPDGSDAAYAGTVTGHLKADPWYDPASLPDQQYGSLAPVGTVGGFRGFGGTFLNPPEAFRGNDGRIHLRDSEGAWVLFADRFGATLHRTDPQAKGKPGAAGAFRIDARGKVVRDGAGRRFPHLAGAASSADDGSTLAVCLPLSHHVHLIAWKSDAGRG